MYCFYLLKDNNNNNNNNYDIKHDFKDINDFKNRYNLNNRGYEKEYWINNLRIIKNDSEMNFNFIKDLNISKQNKFLVQEYEEFNCEKFNFYKTDTEESYEKYSNKINDVNILLKKYKDFFTIEFYCDNKTKFNDFFL